MTKLQGRPDVPPGTHIAVRLLWDVPLQGAARGLSPKFRDAVYDWGTGKYMDQSVTPAVELEFPHPRAGQNDNALRGPLVAAFTVGAGAWQQKPRYPLNPYETADGVLDITVDPQPAAVVAAQSLLDLIDGTGKSKAAADAAAAYASQQGTYAKTQADRVDSQLSALPGTVQSAADSAAQKAMEGVQARADDDHERAVQDRADTAQVTEQMRSVAGTYSLGRVPQAGDPAGMYRWVDPAGQVVDIAWNGSTETGRTVALATAQQATQLQARLDVTATSQPPLAFKPRGAIYTKGGPGAYDSALTYLGGEWVHDPETGGWAMLVAGWNGTGSDYTTGTCQVALFRTPTLGGKLSYVGVPFGPNPVPGQFDSGGVTYLNLAGFEAGRYWFTYIGFPESGYERGTPTGIGLASTTDFLSWQRHGPLLMSGTGGVSDHPAKSLWRGRVRKINGRYYLFFNAGATGEEAISYAVADRLAGPYAWGTGYILRGTQFPGVTEDWIADPDVLVIGRMAHLLAWVRRAGKTSCIVQATAAIDDPQFPHNFQPLPLPVLTHPTQHLARPGIVETPGGPVLMYGLSDFSQIGMADAAPRTVPCGSANWLTLNNTEMRRVDALSRQVLSRERLGVARDASELTYCAEGIISLTHGTYATLIVRVQQAYDGSNAQTIYDGVLEQSYNDISLRLALPALDQARYEIVTLFRVWNEGAGATFESYEAWLENT